MIKVDGHNISVVIPAKNEASSLSILLPKVRRILPRSEIILVNDGSTDDTVEIAGTLVDVLVSHPHSLGNGAAIKAGTRASSRDVLLFMDADGQHNPEDMPLLLEEFSKGHAMVVGARNVSSHASFMRRIANAIYNTIATYMTGQRIVDLTSGYRVVEAKIFRRFLYMLPNGFSYPTTITMALARTGNSIKYVPIKAEKREGKSHISPVKDGIRFMIIIFKIGAMYSPLKLFAPTSIIFFIVSVSYYLYTYISDGRFTNMGILLFIASLLIFMLGILSEQITTLMYSLLDSETEEL